MKAGQGPSSHQRCVLSIDLGAESGRSELVTFTPQGLHMRELHRFANRPVRLGSTLAWDFPHLMAEIYHSLRLCSEQSIPIQGVGVDTWGVDFGLLDASGNLIANPVHYRDTRTQDIHTLSDAIMSKGELFAATACEPWSIASLFQLIAMQTLQPELFSVARTFLHMPDLINYFLTGKVCAERSIASTACLMDTDGCWSAEILHRFELPAIFPTLYDAGTVLGGLRPEIAHTTALGDVPVIAVCGHDTAAAVASIPLEDQTCAFLSCGTWSILGKTRARPLTDPKCLQQGFSNEATLGGWYLCRHIIGLWIVQELLRQWNRSDDAWDYPRAVRAADVSSTECLIPVAEPTLMAPPDMEAALRTVLRITGQDSLLSRGHLLRCVFQSLALEYALRLDQIDELTGERTVTLALVGGGARNTLLCQYTANASQRLVLAGLDQCTAVGNALVQALALGWIPDMHSARALVSSSSALVTYHPQELSLWSQLRRTYTELSLTNMGSEQNTKLGAMRG